MPVVNLENITFIGPGSEWFWTALSGLTVAATLIVIYRQLRAQRSAALYEQSAGWTKDWAEESLVLARLRCLVDLEDRPVENGLPRSFADVGDYFERLGYLARQHHLRKEDLYEEFRLRIGWWWALAEPYIRRQREIEGFPLFEEFERLEHLMQRLDLKHLGKQAPMDVSPQIRRARAEDLITQLRATADARKGVFPTFPLQRDAVSKDGDGPTGSS